MVRSNFKTRNFMLELYPDNSVHSSAFDFIIKSDMTYIYILHHIKDIDGNEIVEGEGKPHYHLIICFENPVYASALAKKLGMISDLGEPDLQFIQAVRNLDDSLLYLTHVKYEDKEKYSFSDLHGSSFLIKKYETALYKYIEKKKITIREALWAVRTWINEQKGRISYDMFVKYLCSSPYVRFRNERLFYQLIEEHNYNCQTYKNMLEEYARSQIILNQRTYGRDIDDISHLEMTDEELERCVDL